MIKLIKSDSKRYQPTPSIKIEHPEWSKNNALVELAGYNRI
jgi:hypothetical protein